MRTATPRELGAALRDSRKNLGLTQLEVAGAAGVQRSWLARLEGGNENPTFAKLLAVASTLGLHIELTSTADLSTESSILATPVDLDLLLAEFDERP